MHDGNCEREKFAAMGHPGCDCEERRALEVTDATMNDKAIQIVNYVLDYTERAATITGSRKHRTLMFGSGRIDMKTGLIREHIDVLREGVLAIISGCGEYRAILRPQGASEALNDAAKGDRHE